MGKIKISESQIDEMFDNEEIVYSLYWDSGSPGAGADVEAVFKWNNKYFPVLSYEDVIYAYDSLEEALDECELLSITDAVVSIACSEISSEELFKLLSYNGDGEHIVLINQREYLFNQKEETNFS